MENTILFYNAQEFMAFLRRHGQKTDGKFEVFANHRREKVPQREHYGFLAVPYIAYQAHVKVLDEIYVAVFVTLPAAPTGWDHGLERAITRSETSKAEAVKVLTELGVPAEQLKSFKKVTVSELQRIVDESSEDDAAETDDRRIIVKRDKHTMTFKANGAEGIDSVQLAVGKQSCSIRYRLTADWSKQWKAREDEAALITSDADTIVYKGEL